MPVDPIEGAGPASGEAERRHVPHGRGEPEALPTRLPRQGRDGVHTRDDLRGVHLLPARFVVCCEPSPSEHR